MLSTDDIGRDLASVQTLQRKHEGVERDLAALEEKVKQLSGEADRLCETHPDQTDDIRSKQEQIERQWQELRDKAADRRKLLDDSYHLHRFLSDYRFVCGGVFVNNNHFA